MPGVRPATALVLLLAIVTGANLFTEPYLLTGGGGPDGASTTPVLLMYQQGIEQGKPDIGLGHRRRAGRRRADHRADQPSADRTERTMTTSRTQADHRAIAPDADGPARSHDGRPSPGPEVAALAVMAALFIGALVFLFPFYYMIVGSLQTIAEHLGRRRVPAAVRT